MPKSEQSPAKQRLRITEIRRGIGPAASTSTPQTRLETESVYNSEKHAGKAFHGLSQRGRNPMDLAYHQPVRASRVEVSEDCLSFFTANGTLAAFFDKSAVHSWREINESELLAN